MLAALAVPCGAAAQAAPAGFISFDFFLASVATADAARYVLHPGTKVVSRDAFEDMRRHVLSLYDGVHVAHSFVYNEQYIDCVPILEQPSARALGLKEIPQPPPPTRLARLPAAPPTPSPFELGLSDTFGNVIACQAGTIPMRRITLDELSRFATLKDYLRKAPGASPPPPAVDYAGFKHRTLGTAPNNLGAGSQFEVWYPFVDTNQGEYHSLSQLWVLGYGNNTVQSAEAGWQVAPSHYNTNAAVAFIFWTPDGYTSGCYNLECIGFVQVNNNVVLGAPNWSGPSQPGGQQVVFDAEWEAVRSVQDGTIQAWWFYYNCQTNYYHCAVGYLPVSVYGGGQLSQYSNSLQFGGETYSYNHTNNGAMGSGALPSAGPSNAAYQTWVFYVDLTRRARDANLAYLNFPQTDACYGELCTIQVCDSFYFGGPGGLNCPGQ